MKFVLLALCAIFLFAIYKITQSAYMVEKERTEIKLSSAYNRPLSFYDPVIIENAAQHITLLNIYSPLLEYTSDGKLVSAIASSFHWVGDEAHFRIRPDLKTIDGHKINAYDIENTFKRLFILRSNTHGDIKNIISRGIKLRTLSDECPSIEVREDGSLFVIKMKKNFYLFPMLTAMDYAIIPIGSLDKKTLKIKDYRNTSGPYYVEDNTNEHMLLKVNPAHFHYSESIPSKVEFLYIKNAKSDTPSKMFIENKINHIATISSSPDILLDYFSKDKNVEMHLTKPIWLRFVSFTERGRKELSEKERIIIANILKNILLSEFLKLKGFEEAEQLFPNFSKGALSLDELSKIKEIYSDKYKDVFEKKMVAWFFPKAYIDKLKKHFPNTEFVDGANVPCFIDFDKEKIESPYFYFAGTDMGFQEDISLLSYKINTENFYLTGKRGKEWMKKYIKENNEKERIKMLKRLHFITLEKAVTVPIVFCSYVAVVKKPWRLNFPKYTYDNNFWGIHYDE